MLVLWDFLLKYIFHSFRCCLFHLLGKLDVIFFISFCINWKFNCFQLTQNKNVSIFMELWTLYFELFCLVDTIICGFFLYWNRNGNFNFLRCFRVLQFAAKKFEILVILSIDHTQFYNQLKQIRFQTGKAVSNKSLFSNICHCLIWIIKNHKNHKKLWGNYRKNYIN